MPSPSDFFNRLEIEGGGLANFNNIGSERLLLSATLELSVEQASELSFAMNDPNWAYLQSFGAKGPLEKLAVYEDLQLACVGFTMDGGPSGSGGAELRLQPRGIFRCRKITGALTREALSPSQFAADSAINCGMRWVVEDSPQRPSISRDVAEENSKDEVNEWTTLQRLAGEEGFLVFESYNTLYFASPQWLFDHQKEHIVGVGNSVSDDAMRLLRLPSVTVSSSSSTSDELSFELPMKAAGRIITGSTIRVLGVPKPMGETKLLVTTVSYPLAGTGSVSITAKKPWIIEKQSQESAGDSGDGISTANLPGNTDGERAVNAALSKRGVTYAWGGGSYDGPTKGIRDGGVADSYGDYNKVGFDCSGLMQYAWYQGSKGRVRLPRTTYNQRNAGPRVSMSQLIPGDLIMMNGDQHVGIYAGNGNMVEAPQSGDVVKVSSTRGGYGVRIQ